MSGSELSKALETVYGPISVLQMLSSKDMARALHEYYLNEATFISKVITKAFLFDPYQPDVPSEDIDYDKLEVVHDSSSALHQLIFGRQYKHLSAISDSIIEKVQTCCEALLTGSVSVDEVHAHETLKTKQDHIQQYKDQFTTCLGWLHSGYSAWNTSISSISIRAEKIGDWKLHITAAVKQIIENIVNNNCLIHMLYLQLMHTLLISVATIIMNSSSNVVTILLEDQPALGRNMDRFIHLANHDAYYQILWWSHWRLWYD